MHIVLYILRIKVLLAFTTVTETTESSPSIYIYIFNISSVKRFLYFSHAILLRLCQIFGKDAVHMVGKMK